MSITRCVKVSMALVRISVIHPMDILSKQILELYILKKKQFFKQSALENNSISIQTLRNFISMSLS